MAKTEQKETLIVKVALKGENKTNFERLQKKKGLTIANQVVLTLLADAYRNELGVVVA